MNHDDTEGAHSDDPRIVLQRLIESRGVDYSALSRRLGRNPAYIQQYIKRGTPRRLSEDDRALLAAYFDVPETMLGARVGGRVAARRDGDPVVLVPQLEVGASAGLGLAVEGEAVTGGIGFDRRWLRRLGVDPRRVSIIRVVGDSMEPTLFDGDDILVNHADDVARLRDGIYVLRLDEALKVKRLSPGSRHGTVDVLSDNKVYGDLTEVPLDRVAIVGRVSWAGRTLR